MFCLQNGANFGTSQLLHGSTLVIERKINGAKIVGTYVYFKFRSSQIL